MGKDRWTGTRGNRDGNRRGGSKGGYSRGGFRGGSRGRGFGANRDDNQDKNSKKQWYNKPRRETPGKRLSEEQIGVVQYMSDHVGFNGIIKSRYSDFQVSEINERGEVAKLTTYTPPELPDDDTVEEDEELLLSKYNLEILPMETWDQINKIADGTATEPVEIDVSKSSKEERTKIHDAVKKAFGEVIIGSTVNTDDKKIVRFVKYKKGVHFDNRVKWKYPGEYVYFIVHKENCDTMEAAIRIAERLGSHVKPSVLGYAGTKDRRAKTSQWFSIRRFEPRRLAVAGRALRDVFLGDYSFHHVPLKLGMLKGNLFRIALRNVTAAEEEVAAACELLREKGFLNYYGLQRFGSRVEVPTYQVGLLLLRGKFKEAIDCILEEYEGPLQKALQLYKSHGAELALAAMPRHCQGQSEARVIQALAEHPKDLIGALQRVPRNTRLLYLHAYQSLAWNRCMSERVRRLGLRPAAGDLVPTQPGQLKDDVEVEESDSEETPDDAEKSSESMDDPKTDVKPDKKQEKAKPQEKKIHVKVLTQEDVDSGKYTIYDVIMPMPGYLIEYPPNMKDYYEKLLSEDGLTLDLKHKYKSYSLSGAYRHVAVRPEGVAWRCVRYSDPRADLLRSDVDELRARGATGPCTDGLYKAVILTFTLPPSCYATMALRELLRVDTSSDNQAKQNDYHLPKRSRDDGEDSDGESAKRPKKTDSAEDSE